MGYNIAELIELHSKLVRDLEILTTIGADDQIIKIKLIITDMEKHILMVMK